MTKVTVKLNRLRMSPRKIRLVADPLRRRPVDWAAKQLSFSPKRAAGPLLKLVKSGIAAAKSKNLEPSSLLVKELRVDEGPRLKRWLPAPRGRTYHIRKPTSHITLTLAESENSKHEARNPKQNAQTT